jgi:hypothetical protein
VISSSFNSKFVLVDSVLATDSQENQFGQNIEWLGTDLFAVSGNLTTPFVTNDIQFSDATYFDGGSTEFGQLHTTYSQRVDVFQVLKTNRNWINSPQDILNPVPVTTIPVTGDFNTSILYAGAIDNLFIADASNPDESIKIFNNPNLSHGWTVFTAQEQQIDSGSIGRAWIYDSVTQIKLADLEVVDLYAGILPGTIASQLDFISDIDPACYNIPLWIPGGIYSIGDRVLYGNQIYQALYAGKSGSIFNATLWSLVSAQPNVNTEGIIKWGANQIGRTWFKTKNLKVVHAQLGNLTQRAQNSNQWFPNSAIQIFEWVNSSVPPASYSSNEANGYVLDTNAEYTYDPATAQYGFWVYNKNSLGPIHNQTTSSLIEDVINIPNSGIPMITALDTNAVAVWNINQFVSANTVVLHIDYIAKSADNELHNEFALISNDGSKSWYTTSIYPKLVDSLSGVSTTNQLVPDYTIPINQQTGILNNPVQSLFVDRTTAVNIYFTTINSELANIAVATTSIISALSVFDPIPTSGFNEQISGRSVLNELDPSLFPENYRILLTVDDTLTPPAWSIVAIVNGQWQIAQYQLYNLANNWKYSDWYSTEYVAGTPTYVLDNPGQLSQITYVSGDIIQINNNGNGNEVLFLAVQNDIDPTVTELDPIYIQNGTIQFLPNLYDFLASGIGFDNQGFDSQPFDNDPYLQIRLITQILNDTIFVGSEMLTAAADNGFYAILKFILYENKNLDWLFKSSFVTVDYDNRNLNIQGNYEPDNQSSIEDFVSETLPYHVRVREFRDTYSASDYGNIGVVDFDLPAQYDSNYANIVYDFTANPKLNINLPLSPFRDTVGVSSDSTSSYIRSNGIPANPTMPSTPQNWQFGITTTPVTIPVKFNTVSDLVGPIAVAIDGVPFYSPNSGETETLYLYGNVSHPLANVGTSSTFTINSVWESQQNSLDPGTGFANKNGVYEYLTNPYIMSNVSFGTHSPIIGYAWDGNPIYGPYGYENANGTGGIIVNTSSYQLSSTPRLSKTGQPFINGLQLAVYASPNGEYIEDFVYIPNLGTLDACNGRLVVTPDYPNGTYAYFATVETSNVSIPTYPYIIGPCYNSRPFGIRYVYINGVNTPIYLNGNVNIPSVPTINTVQLIRTPDGTVQSDSLTLQEPIYTPWNNNHGYSITSLNVERPGIGYINLDGNVIITPNNNAAANITSLQVVSANLVIGGNGYTIGEYLSFIGGTYDNAANVQITGLGANNSVSSFILTNVPNQLYTVVPSNFANISTSSSGGGSGATFSIAFGVESILLINNGNNFIYTPTVTISDINATTAATVYPELGDSLVRQLQTTIAFNRVNSAPYPGVFVNSGQFVESYIVPTGTIFDSNDATSGQTSLNISWRPELISDTALSTEYSRFGNSAGVFNSSIDQYITANTSSPDISTLSINANSFTLEFFMNFSNISSNLAVMVDTRANVASANGLVVFRENRNLCIGANTNVSIITANAIPFTTNDWEYITVQGNNGILYGYINGQLIGTANIGYDFIDDGLTLGADVTGGNVSTGYMDEIRLTKNFNRYTPGIINISVPTEPFPRSISVDPYLLPHYTPLLWGFENLYNESETNITFTPINAQTLISDLSWNQKKLQLINYGANLVINSATINTIESPQTSEILSVILNQQISNTEDEI